MQVLSFFPANNWGHTTSEHLTFASAAGFMHLHGALYYLDSLEDDEFGDTSEQGRLVWQIVLRAVEAGKLAVDRPVTRMSELLLLHHAAEFCSVGVMQRLLQLGAPPSQRDCVGHTPMHYAAKSRREALAKCKLLPVADLASLTNHAHETPLHVLAWNLRRLLLQPVGALEPARAERFGGCEAAAVHLEVLEWMLDQPECPIDAANCYGDLTAAHLLGGTSARAMVRTAQAARARWTPLRAAWTGVVGAALGTYPCH
jgi:hypothetical protein